MVLASNWMQSLLRDGFIHFPRLIDEEIVRTARTRIDEDLERNYDPSRKLEYEHRSFCPDLLGSREITALCEHPSVQERIKNVLSRKHTKFDNGQIAIRKAHNADQCHAPVPHIDGIPTPHNGVTGDELAPFTMLVGIFLSDVRREFAGNFTVWPGSHYLLENHFKARGTAALREGMPQIPLGEPVQLLCTPGDVVICHYQLAHTAAVNTSDNDRYAVFFRIWHRDLDRHVSKNYRENVWQHLTNIWTGWKIAP